jgi:hypothetical protein
MAFCREEVCVATLKVLSGQSCSPADSELPFTFVFRVRGDLDSVCLLLLQWSDLFCQLQQPAE